MEATGWIDSLRCYADSNYSIGADSINWTNNRLCLHVAAEYDNVAYMEKRLMAHTLLIEPDKVLKTHGIHNLDHLRTLARNIYEPMYPEDASITDETDLHNTLNRFVAYHILPFKAGYYQLTAMDGDQLVNNWDRTKWDIADWYETCMPHSLMKCSFPKGTAVGNGRSEGGLWINRRGVQDHADEQGVFVRGARVYHPSEMEGKGTGVNGNFFYIDDIIAYDQQTQGVVLNERMRIDCTTLSPDFITSGARGHANAYGRPYNTHQTATTAANNSNRSMGFKSGSTQNFDFNDEETHLHVRPRTLSYWSYGGDELIIQGRPYDVRVKLPSLPAGKYELRLGTVVGFDSSGIVQFYIDDVPAGIPVDLRPNSETLFGWKHDSNDLQNDEDQIAAFDKAIRNLGWMKGPDTYASGDRTSWDSSTTTFRNQNNTLRKVIGTFTTDGKTDHYLRRKQVLDSYSEMAFDYIELVPASVYDNEEVPEDRH